MYKTFEPDSLSDRRNATLPYRATRWASFADYVGNRRYDFGRGTSAAWLFIAFARGDAQFANPASWRELEQYLTSVDADPSLVKGARSVWRSYVACRSRARHAFRSERGIGR